MKALCHVFFDEYPKDSRIRRYTNLLIQNNFPVSIICIGENEPFYEVVKGGIHIYRLPIKKKRSSIGRRIQEYLFFEVFAFILSTYVFFRHTARIYHVHTLPDFLVFSCLVPKIFGAKIILDFHELFAEFMMQHKASLDKGSWIIKLLMFQEKLAVQFADTIITFHDPAKKIIVQRTNSKKMFTVIMNGIDESELPTLEKMHDQIFRVIYNGTINFNLNLGLVIDAFSVLKDTRPEIFKNIEFALYGDGPELKTLLQKSQDLGLDNVKYYGRLKFSAMVIEISKASLCILPPIKDIYSDLFYSLKLLEMIYFRIPIIATRLNTYEEYYPDNCLFYFESNNVKQLVETIELVYNSPQVVQIKTMNAFNEYKKYSWGIMSQRYLDVLKHLDNNTM